MPDEASAGCDGDRAARIAAILVGGGVAIVTLGWWSLTDRLDLPKLALLGVVAIAGAGLRALRGEHRAEPLIVVIGSLGLLGLLVAGTELAARVEGWLGWCAALLLGWLARRADPRRVGALLALTGALVGALAVLQAAGLDWLAGTRTVSGTLGGPGHLGWTLASLLPFCAALPGPVGAAATGVTGAGLALSGSRTAWAMVAASLPLWPRRGPLLALLLGSLGGIALDAATGRADLAGRAADLADPTGTAHGRGYLWRLYASSPGSWLGAGGGPEAFQRRFPAMQDAWLAAHPEDRPFRSDLRHAHVDIVEIGADLGIAGLLLVSFAAARALRSGPLRDAPAASLVAVAVGGLASPVLFFAPTLAVAGVAAGLRIRTLPPPEVRFGIAPLLVLSLAGEGILARRTASEIVRSEATFARITGDAASARATAERSARIDARNPRAHIETALSCLALEDRPCAREALRRAARDLPSDGVRSGAE